MCKAPLLFTFLNFDDLQDHPSLGSSWEGFVIEQIIVLLSGNREIYFYRTDAGAEIDLLFFDNKNNPVAIEIKYSMSPAVSRGFWNACEDLSCTKGYVVYPGNEIYPIGKNIFTLPFKQLEKILE